jgi:hypothetical protein
MAKRDKKKLASRISIFAKKYARRAHPGHDPNDRNYDRKIEKLVKRMKPEELDRIMRDDDT